MIAVVRKQFSGRNPDDEDHNAQAMATYERLGMVSAGYRVLERCPL